jgi:hypothetical protein
MRRLFLTVFFVLAGCSSGDDLAAAQKAISHFHDQMNAGQFDKIYVESSPEWKQVSPKDDTIELFTGVRAKLGAFLSGKQNSWRVNYGTGGTTILVLYDSKFQKADGQETFTYRRSGDGVQLVGYNINSRALITG